MCRDRLCNSLSCWVLILSQKQGPDTLIHTPVGQALEQLLLMAGAACGLLSFAGVSLQAATLEMLRAGELLALTWSLIQTKGSQLCAVNLLQHPADP